MYEFLELKLDSIAISLFGNMTVETREIHIITKGLEHPHWWREDTSATCSKYFCKG